MNKTFIAGVVAGAISLVAAVPLIAQLTSAKPLSSSSAAARQTPTVACVQAQAAAEDLQLTGMDAMHAARKSAIAAHSVALKAAAKITDDTQREAALKKANEDMRTAMQAAAPTAEHKAAMEAVRTACGNNKGGMFMGGGMGGGMGMGKGLGLMEGSHGKGSMMGRGQGNCTRFEQKGK